MSSNDNNLTKEEYIIEEIGDDIDHNMIHAANNEILSDQNLCSDSDNLSESNGSDSEGGDSESGPANEQYSSNEILPTISEEMSEENDNINNNDVNDINDINDINKDINSSGDNNYIKNIFDNRNIFAQKNIFENMKNMSDSDAKNNDLEDHDTNEILIQNQPQKLERKKRIPKKILDNQIKYLETIEKQNRMTGKKNKSNIIDTKNAQNLSNIKSTNTFTKTPGTRRVMIAGKIRYLPIKTEETIKPVITIVPEPIPEIVDDLDHNKKLKSDIKPDVKPDIKSDIELNKPEIKHDPENRVKRIPTGIAKNMEKYNLKMEKERSMSNTNKKNIRTKKIPSKYARHIENDIKRQSVKNVKNFSDLRRIKAIQNLEPEIGIDTNKASILELRKLRVDQRKREQAEHRKKLEENKKESAVQEILNSGMSRFSKMVAIKNLSVNSRNRKNISKNITT
ncbi:hypothetical protein QLL95_gp0764 [Cotonvirus japonicus]|uniref:Uncharacterized protein n=1 Tax=Cotonvirus japonicus TaxID=2811091 RepID=A0ABM7NTA5_9VIRU|nr:hypothetical protein QLL95_gp0764 [Cotonvirus japonicus]BCS83359.1 hypothetical protein [Cotonvirus japonicus]